MGNEKKDGILLETGTNEIEIMEFTINDNLYGINVAKVREIMLSDMGFCILETLTCKCVRNWPTGMQPVGTR